jgi:hypothetical protein
MGEKELKGEEEEIEKEEKIENEQQTTNGWEEILGKALRKTLIIFIFKIRN